jgi:glycerophosphoryl diester phosphodiesterase
MVIPRNMLGNLAAPTTLVANAHAAGLKVHPWTFRRENYFLPLSAKSGVNPAAHGDVGAEIRAYIAAGVDGLFTDNVAEGVAVRK